MSKIKHSVLFSFYVTVSISALIFISIHYWAPLMISDYSELLIYLFLLIFISSSPIKIGDIFIMFNFAITLTVFLEYGLVVEVWLTQITTLVSLLTSVHKRSIYRILLSQAMFFWISWISGLSFFLTGGKTGFTMSMVKAQMTPILVYTFSYFLVNHVILYFSRTITEEQKISLYSEDMFWDAATFLFTLPLGLIMYLVKITYGNFGMVFVGLLIITVTQLFKSYSELVHSHKQLKALNKLSVSFTSELNFDKTLSALQQSIRELLSYDYSHIFIMSDDKLKMVSVEHHDGRVIHPDEFQGFLLSPGEGLSGRVAILKKTEMVGFDAEFFQGRFDYEFLRNNKSLLAVPMVWNNETVGVITLGSSSEYHFSKKDITIANILASQAATAVRNATTYQKTEEKSLIDELTGVYNYRAFEDFIHRMVAEAEMRKENLSLLLLDLDYFKKVNDVYGHLAGNEVLKYIAKLLKEHTRREDVIARYGGEEFTVIIPNTNHDQAEIVADRIREAVQRTKIKVKESLKGKEEITLQVTVSIGIASFPEMASSAKELVRNADRAMYVGSKQAGRNRVAIYKAI